MVRIPYASRQGLVSQNNVAVSSGTDFGAVYTSPYTRLSGIAFLASGSMSVRIRQYGSALGPTLTSTVWAVNSGVSILDVPNYASYTYIDVTAANTAPGLGTLQIFGDPVR